MGLTLHHRLILPADANHHGTLYAGSLLRIALEAGYATAYRDCGPQANLVLRRVLNLECVRPVPVGTVIEIGGTILHRSQAYLVAGLLGTSLEPGQSCWLEGLLGFAQIDEAGRPTALPTPLEEAPLPAGEEWAKLKARLDRLLKIR